MYELGCYADGCNGNDYVISKAIQLAEEIGFIPFDDPCKCGCNNNYDTCEFKDEIADNAVDYLNEHSKANGIWCFESGDLLLIERSDDE